MSNFNMNSIKRVCIFFPKNSLSAVFITILIIKNYKYNVAVQSLLF